MHHEYAPEGQITTKLYYLQVLQHLRDAVRCKRPDLWQSQSFKLHHDNAPAHLSQLIVTEKGIPVVRQAPYLPDIAPSDFWLFLKIKQQLKGFRFQSQDDIMQNATDQLKVLSPDEFKTCFEQWKHCWVKCVNAQGTYFEGG